MATALDELVPPPEEDPEERFRAVAAARGFAPSALEPGMPSPATGVLAPSAPPPPPSREEAFGGLQAAQAQIYNRLPYQNVADRRRSTSELAGLRFQERGLEREQRAEEHATRLADRAQTQEEKQNRLKASDLASRGIPTFRNASGGVSEVTDETGAPMIHFDKSKNIAYDSQGNPKLVSFEATAGPPALRDPFADLPTRTDPKTGDQYKVRAGLPWQWQGTDPAIKAQRMQEEKDKALKNEVGLVGRRLSVDHADLVTGDAEHKLMMKELQSSVPVLQDPRLAGAPRETILKAIDDHFNTEYAQPAANETDGWFSKELSPGAQQLRDHIDARKATALETANGLFDLKDRQRELGDRVEEGRQLQANELDTLIAHGRGQPGPLDQPPPAAAPEVAPEAPADLSPDSMRAAAQSGQLPPYAAPAAVAASHDAEDANRKADELQATNPTLADQFRSLGAGIAQGLASGVGEIIKGGIKMANRFSPAGLASQVVGFDQKFNDSLADKTGDLAHDAIVSSIGKSPGALIAGAITGHDITQLDDKLKDTIGAKVGNFIGGAVPYVATSLLQPEVGVPLTVSALFSSGFNNTYEAAKTRGVDDLQAQGLGLLSGSINGVLGLPFKGAGKAIARIFGSSTAEAVSSQMAKAFTQGIETASGRRVVGQEAVDELMTQVRNGLDPWATLKVGQNATKAEINAAFKAQLKQVHPDVSGLTREAATEATTRLNQARKAAVGLVGGASAAERAAMGEAAEAAQAIAAERAKTPAQRAAEVLTTAATHAAIGGGVQTAQNIVTKGYNPETGLFDGVPEQALGFGLLGGLSKGFEAVVRARQAKAALDKIYRETKQPPPPPGGAPPAAPAGAPIAPVAPPAPVVPAGVTPPVVPPATPIPPATPVPPATPIPPTAAAPIPPTTEGVPPSEKVTPTAERPVQQAPPPGEPPRPAGAGGQPVVPHAAPGGGAVPTITPPGYEPGPAPGGAVVPGGGGVAAVPPEGGPPEVPAPAPVAGTQTPQPTAVPGAVAPHLADRGAFAAHLKETTGLDHSPATIDHQYADALREAVAANQPVPAAPVISSQKGSPSYRVQLPAHYERQGDVFAPKAEAPVAQPPAAAAPAPVTPAPPTPAGAQPPAPAAEAPVTPAGVPSHHEILAKGDTVYWDRSSRAPELKDQAAPTFLDTARAKVVSAGGKNYAVPNILDGDTARKVDLDALLEVTNNTSDPAILHSKDIQSVTPAEVERSGDGWKVVKKGAVVYGAPKAGAPPTEPPKAEAPAAAAPPVAGDVVTFTQPTVAYKEGKPITVQNKVTGKVTFITPDGRIEVKLQRGGYRVFTPEEFAKEVAKVPTGAQPPPSGPVKETLPPAETPPTAGEGEPGVGGPVQPGEPRHNEAERTIQEFHAALPRGIRVSHFSGRSVPLVRVSPATLGNGGGIAVRLTSATGQVDLIHAPEVVADSIDVMTAAFIERGKTPEEAKAAALDLFKRGMAGEAGHARELIVSGATNLVRDRERVWHEMNPTAKLLMPRVYDVELPKESRNRTLTAEYVRMKFQLANGIMPEEADINPEAFAELLPYLQQAESPWIEAHLKAMDDLTKQDTELPFRTDGLNELYQFHAKKDLSDAQTQAAVIADAVAGYDDIDEAVDAADSAPADYVHTTGSGHTIDLESFREAVERAKAEEETSTLLPLPPKPEVVSKVPRKPPNVPESIGGPGSISDTDISNAEVVPMYEGTGDLGHEYIQMPDGSQIPVTYKLVDSRLVVDNPDNEQPDATFKETQDYLLQTSGANYDARFPFVRDPAFLSGPGIGVTIEGRIMKLGGHRRHYRDLIMREEYESALPKNVAKFGINPEFVKAMQEKGGWPYLMAVVDDVLTPEQESAIGRYLNTTKEQPKNPVFEAISAGRQLSPETLDTAGALFEQNFEKPPLAMLKSAAARDLVAAMFKDGALRETDRAKYIADNGGFTEEGAKFARLALVGHIIDDVQVLDSIQGTQAMTKLLNGLSQLYVMKRRGQDMDKFTQMLRSEYERLGGGDESKKLTMLQYQQQLDQNMFDRRYADIEAIHEWFNSFPPAQAKKAFLKALNDFLPLEKGQEDMVAKNVDMGEGLIRQKNLDTLSMMKPGKGGGMTEQEKVLKTLREKEAAGTKLTPAEHDLVLKIEKKLGQKLLIDPNKTPRKIQEPDVFPQETPEIEPKRAKLGGQTDLDIISQGIEKSGQQTLFMLKPKSQPPARPEFGGEKAFSEALEKSRKWNEDLNKWLDEIPVNQPLIFTDPNRPDRYAYVTPVVPREEIVGKTGFVTKATKPGDYRVTWFHRLGETPAQGVIVEPTGHDERGSKIEAVKAAISVYPQFAPDTLFMAKPKGPPPPGLPGFEEPPEIRWKAGADGGTWHGQVKDVSYSIIEDPQMPGVRFAIHFFNPEGGGADAIGAESSLRDAQKAAETHYAFWKADNRNRPTRRESYKLEGPRKKLAREHPEFRFDVAEQKRIPQNKPVSLLTSRAGMTQKSKVNFLPERFKKILKPHQQHGVNLALWAFDGGTGFLNNDGPGAGKTAQQLTVGQIMANTKAKEDTYDEHGRRTSHYSKEHGTSPRRRPLPEGMTHATIIITENERIIQNAFAKDAEMLGIEAWRYMGDDPKPDRVYLATYNDVRSGLIRKGQFRTMIFDEAQGLRNAGYETAQALAGTKLSALAQHVMYATATPFDKPEQIVYLQPLLGEGAVKQVFDELGIKIKKGKPDPKGKVDVRFSYPDDITAADIERVKEAIFTELTRNGKMISRNVPLDNVRVKFVEVPITDAAFLTADAMYRRIYAAVAEKSTQNAGGVAGMTVRAFLENQKIEPTLKMVHESVKAGKQVVIFASRIKQGTAGSYQEGIEGTLDNLHAELERVYGKGTIGQVYGGDNQRSVRDIDRFQRNAIKVMLGTPNSAGTGINLDDTFGDVPRDMIIITAPLSAIELIQDIGRINRLTTLSTGNVAILFVDHPVDTWNIDIGADKMRTLSAMVSGDLKNIKPLEQRTAEIKLNDDAVALMTVFQREPMFQKLIRQIRTGQPGYISEKEARERLTSPNKQIKEEAQGKADKFFKDIQDETDRQRNNQAQMSEDEIMRLVDDEQAFSALSPGHARFQKALDAWVRNNTIFPTDAEMLRAFAAQAKGDLLDKIDYASTKMNPLGRGGGSFGGRGTIELQEERSSKHNPYLSNNMGKVTLHEYGHVAYFVLLTVPERRFVARMYAKLGGRSGTQAYFVSGTPQAKQSKSRYYAKNVYEFFAEGFAQYVMEKRVPGEMMARLNDRVLGLFLKNLELLRRRKDITREPGWQNIYEKALDVKKNAKDIDFSYPERASMQLSTVPPKGLSRGQMERYLKNKADIYNSLALNRSPVLNVAPRGATPVKGAPKFSTVPERITPRVHPLPSGVEPIVPTRTELALRGQPLPKSLGGFESPEGLHPVATETLLGGKKNHFYITSTPAGHTLFMRSMPEGTMHARSPTLKSYDAVLGVLKNTLDAGAKMGARHVWHKLEGGEHASEITSTEGVGVRGKGGDVGTKASLRQSGQAAGEGKEEKVQEPAGRGGGVPLDPADPGQSGIPLSDTLAMLKPAQLRKVTGVDWVSKSLSDIKSLLLPTAKSKEHLRAAEDVGAFLGERNRQQEIAKRQIRASWKMFERAGVSREDLPFDQHPGSKFASDVSTGRPMSPELQKVADIYRNLLDERIKRAAEAGAPLNELRDYYFPGYWTVASRRAFNQAMDELIPEPEEGQPPIDVNNLPESLKTKIRERVEELLKQDAGTDHDRMSAFARRPLKGPEKFRHQAVFDDKITAEELGLKPVFPNPADAVMAKLAEMDQSIMANQLIRKWKAEGKLKVIPPTARPPTGWREFPDPFGTVYARSNEYGLRIVGKRIVPDAYADIIENHLSPTLYQNRYLGRPYTLWMGFANAMNQTQLGVGSAFHAGFTTAEAQVSSIANLIKDLFGVMRGNRTAADLGNTFKNVGTAMYSTMKVGDAVLNAWNDPTPSQDPAIAQVVRAAELAGAGFQIEKGLKTEQIDKQYRDWFSGHKIRAAMRSPAAFVELAAKPIMEYLVPRQKAGVFAHMVWRIIETNRGKTLEELTPQFRAAWNRIDARLGQVQYRRLFANNTAKNIVQMLVRAPGWSGGTIAELGGSIKDAGDFFREWQRTGSLPKDVPDRVAYAIALVVTVGLMNAALTFLFTGRKPEGDDYVAFRTGREDEHGNPERFVLPTYMKDLYAYGKHPGETLLHKTHPALSVLSELIKNKDYYGVEVRDPDASVVKQTYQSGKHVIKSFTPFWFQGARRAAARGKGLPEKVLPLIGVMPAPRGLTQTAAQAELEKYWGTHQPEAGISPEQFETQQAKRSLVSQIRKGGSPDLTKAIQSGAIKPRDISDLYKRARMGAIASSVNRLPLEEAEKVFAAANPMEREKLAGILERKRAGSLRRGGRTMYQGF